MENAASLFAAIATTIAAMMTAANLGPRVTGWGFVVFTAGAVGWLIVAFVTGQTNLLWQNGILLLIDVVGIWRWLGREARFEKGGQDAADRSARRETPSLFPVSLLSGCPIGGEGNDTVAHAVDAMADRETGRIAYVVAREGGVGGVGERLHAIDWREITATDTTLSTPLSPAAIAALPEIAPDQWPSAAPRA